MDQKVNIKGLLLLGFLGIIIGILIGIQDVSAYSGLLGSEFVVYPPDDWNTGGTFNALAYDNIGAGRPSVAGVILTNNTYCEVEVMLDDGKYYKIYT
ncbi:MAG: hypothetical protein CVT89_02325, partial [Candidatus Altiarchaeales archaeon HGW-Altiarchaeales-2]